MFAGMEVAFQTVLTPVLDGHASYSAIVYDALLGSIST
jgi:RsiW-degrading membrane proteinase PrsW (M82 family)